MLSAHPDGLSTDLGQVGPQTHLSPPEPTCPGLFIRNSPSSLLLHVPQILLARDDGFLSRAEFLKTEENFEVGPNASCIRR